MLTSLVHQFYPILAFNLNPQITQISQIQSACETVARLQRNLWNLCNLQISNSYFWYVLHLSIRMVKCIIKV